MKQCSNLTLGGKDVTLYTRREYRDETTREIRSLNAANFLLENWDTLSDIGFTIGCKKLRDLFIECLGAEIRNSQGRFLSEMPTRVVDTEERRGDDRATGDALGGHGLMLDIVTKNRGKGEKVRVIKLNDQNHERLDNFVTAFKIRKLDVIE